MSLRLTQHTIALAALFVALSTGVASAATTDVPHIPLKTDTDVCAMCHRTHTSASDGWVENPLSLPETRSALLAVPSVGAGDVNLCYTCHGVDLLGAETDVQGSFESSSGHRLAPEASAFGPAIKQCSTCHDSHGGDRVATDTPFPSLLRVTKPDGTRILSGSEYCATCHADRPADTWDGLEVFGRTAHSGLPMPSSGTKIVCSNCHDPHGSSVAPSILTSLTPPSVPATTSVFANDRTMCLKCHEATSATWSGETTYATSAHGSSIETIAIPGEWPMRDLTVDERSRKVGECQVCHAPMGRSDGATGTIAKLVDKPGKVLCYQCHDADGPAKTDNASMAYPAARIDNELVAVWRPSVETSIYGDVAVYTRDVTSTVPAPLDGPRVYRPSAKTGDSAAGDLDGDGNAELIVADPSRDKVDMHDQDPLRGLSVKTLTIPGGVKPHLVALANMIADGSGPHGAHDERPELAIVERDATAPHASRLHVYTYDGSGLVELDATPALPNDAIGLDVGDDASGLATGQLTGTILADLVVTAAGSDQIRIFAESGGLLVEAATSPIATGAGTRPRGPSVGEVWAGQAGNEIVVCNAGVTTDNVSIYSATGAPLANYTASGTPGAGIAYDSAIGDVLHGVTPAGTSGLEVVVALRTDPTTDTVNATSRINVWPQIPSGNGLSNADRQVLDTGLRYESSAVEIGDIDGDTHAEIAVGNAGKWLRFGDRQAPSVQLFDSGATGNALALSRTLWSTGVEQASGIESAANIGGSAPSVVIANFGGVGKSRHPVDAGTVTHVSTETATVARHVACVDCHNSHETTATVQTAAPGVFGGLKGAWGAAITNTGPGSAITYAQKPNVTAEYEVCLKCHGAYSNLGSSRNIASEVNTLNASFHSVQGASLTASAPAETFVPITANTFTSNGASWTKNSKMYCVDCHGNANTAEPKGPHTSDEGSILRAPYWGSLASENDLLCYGCHRYDVYYEGTADTGASMSLFQHPARPTQPRMHELHVNTGGFSCRTCHVSHGAVTLPHLQNTDHGYEHTEFGGACTTQCHVNGARRAYTRGIVTAPSLTTVVSGTISSGNVNSVIDRDGVSLVVDELNGTQPGYEIRHDFTGLSAMPSGIEFAGRYQGSPGHMVEVQALKGVTWVTIGTWPNSATQNVYTYALTDPGFLSGGNLSVRVIHTSPGNPNHKQHIDSVWLNP